MGFLAQNQIMVLPLTQSHPVLPVPTLGGPQQKASFPQSAEALCLLHTAWAEHARAQDRAVV